MNELMDGLIAGHLAESLVSCTPIEAGPDLYACAIGQGGGMNDQHGISGTHTLLSVVNAGKEGLGHGVRLTRRVELRGWTDSGRDSVPTQRALQPGRIAQFADRDRDVAIGLLGHRPGRQPGYERMAG
jgi:hypothetical protein